MAFLQADMKATPYYIWTDLANALGNRWFFRSDPEDLEEALSASKKAVDVARLTSNPVYEGFALSQYAECLGYAMKSGSLEEINEIVVIQQQAVKCLPTSHSERPLFIARLASLLTKKGVAEFWIDEHHADDIPPTMKDALACYRNALASLEQVDSTVSRECINEMRAAILIGLARYYDSRQRVCLFSSIADAREALSLVDEVRILPTPTDLWIEAQSIRISASVQIARHSRSHADQVRVLQYYQATVFDDQISLNVRLTAARAWARFAREIGHPSVQEAAAMEMRLSARRVGYGINAIEQVRYLGGQHRSDAVNNAIPFGSTRSLTQYDRDKQLALIDSGLSFFWMARLKTSRSFDIIAEYDPGLKKELDDVVAFLNSHPEPLLRGNCSDSVDANTEERIASIRKAREKLETLLDRVHEIKGLEYFMQPRPFSELCQAANKGHIIVVNAMGGSRCDVFVLKPQSSHVQYVELGGNSGMGFSRINGLAEEWVRLSSRLGEKQSAQSVRDTRHGRRVALKDEESKFKEFLGRLWLEIVNPILEALDLKHANELLPRVWWLPTGVAASLPFHAAGIYDDKTEECALNYVVSSYTYSINSLLDARQAYETQSRTRGKQRLLAVAVPDAPGVDALTSAVSEVESIANHITDSSHVVVLKDKGASKRAILAELPRSPWLHLACHAIQDASFPLASHLVLNDSNLTLEEIANLSIKNAEFAMLSACQTCTGDGTLSDDALHLAAGFMTAGFKSVIATRYSMHDIDGPSMADLVYGQLVQSREWDVEGSAKALHNALQDIRKQVSFRRWLPYVHIGI
ncbi:hypothetical protein VKT23_008209 [Stygiomarasmius scandens]|uniref:CHAT domain-containing protein n=1 Tax=Marasmiellus scandens TaxID=2682957 RepID=A0ABR1JIE4_9AGAR